MDSMGGQESAVCCQTQWSERNGNLPRFHLVDFPNASELLPPAEIAGDVRQSVLHVALDRVDERDDFDR